MNEHDGREVRFVQSTLGKILRHRGYDTARLVPHLKEVFDAALPMGFEAEREAQNRADGTPHKAHRNFVGYHNYLGKITDGGKHYYVRFTVQELKTRSQDFLPNEVHSTFVSDVSLYDEADALALDTAKGAGKVGAAGFVDNILSKSIADFKEARAAVSKAVDENGEPRLVKPGSRHSVTTAWGEDFPAVTLATTLGRIRRDGELTRLHKEAKAGSLDAALSMVDRLFPDKPEKETEKLRVERIKALAADHPDAWLVPVRAEERTGDNMLPFAYANKIKDMTGLPVDYGIKQTAKANHTGADGLHRFLSRAAFDGRVKRGQEYIMVDDHVTQGGTLAALRKHIVNRGGKVVAATTLTASRGSGILSPRDSVLQKLITKFGEDFPALLKKAGVADGLAELSQSEAAYLLKFSPDRVRDTLARASVNVSREAAHRHGPGDAGIVRSRSEGIGRLGEVPRVDGGVRGPSERGAAISPGSLRRASAGRSEALDVIPGFDEYVDPATGRRGETRFAKAPLFHGPISKELNAVIDEADQSTASGEDALKQLNALIASIKSFQFTRPRGARLRTLRRLMSNTLVSIHAPAWGATLALINRLLTEMFQFTRPRGARQRFSSRNHSL